MTPQFKPYERFLRFDSLKNSTELMRGRSVYIIGWVFIFVQCLNVVLMTITYKVWIADHTISVVGMIGVLILIHSLRYTKLFGYFAFAYTVLLFAGITGTSLENYFGINTSLLPLIMAGSLMVGFVAGERYVVLYGVFAMAFIWALYHISTLAEPGSAVSADFYQTRIFQRAVQASLTLVLCSVFSFFITRTVTLSFNKLEGLIAEKDQADREKTEFLANMSHELRTPLNGANGMTQLLVNANLPPESHKFARIAHKCTQSLSLIIADGLELSKIDSGKFVLVEKVFDLKEMTTSLYSAFKPLAEKKGLEFTFRYHRTLPECFIGDERRLRRVLKNLLMNAMKFTPKGSVTFDIRGRLVSENAVKLEISVQDTGVGVEEKDIKRIFNRFEQVEQGMIRVTGGTGLGLAICKEFVKSMGGTVRLESEVGQGSRFVVSLVLQSCEQQSTPLIGKAIQGKVVQAA